MIAKKHTVLIGISIAVSLLIIAMLQYPGGSLFNKNAVGFDWTKNFISNLFAEKAVNGQDNPSRIWAMSGMLFLSVSFGLFFIRFSKKIQIKSAARVLQYLGTAGIGCTFLIVTPLHDLMVTIAATLFLVNLFYITVFVYKSKLHLFKFLCTVCLLISYYTLYLYGSGDYTFLPIMQKVKFICIIILILLLDYFTHEKDFEHIKQPKK